MIFALASCASAAPVPDLFVWFREDGALTLRSEANHEVLGTVIPGLFGPGWTGFQAKAAEDSPRDLGDGRWQYAGSLTPDGQQGAVDYTVTTRPLPGGVELSYQFTTRGDLSLNALLLRLRLPLSFAKGGRAQLPGKEVVFPAAYPGRPSLYYGPGQEAVLRLSAGRISLSAAAPAQLELQDDREWRDDSFELSFHLFHGEPGRPVPAGSRFQQTLRVEVEGMKKVVNTPTLTTRTDTS